MKNTFLRVCFSVLTAGMAALTSCAAVNTNNPGVIFTPGAPPPDRDALNFFARAGISYRQSEARAIGRLVYDLKQANLWTNLDAIYPCVGGTSNSCAQNLISTNWGIAWNGTPQFLRSGVKNSGTDWGDTGYKQSTRGTLTNDFHLYAWAELEPIGVNHSGIIIGNFNAFDSGINNEAAGGLVSTGSGSPIATNYFSGFFLSYTNPVGTLNLITQQRGNAISIRSGNSCSLIGDQLITATLAIYQTPTNTVKLLGDPGVGFPARAAGTFRGTLRAASFGRSLTYSQATNYFAIMNRFQASLSPKTQILTPP